jgi:hypothetical protein
MFSLPLNLNSRRALFSLLLLLFVFAIRLQSTPAQTKTVRMTICQEIDGRKPGEKTGAGLRALKPTDTFELGGLDSYGVLLEFPAYGESQRIDIEAFHINGSDEYKGFGDAIIVARTDTKAYVIGTYSQLGKYKVKATCDDKVIAQEFFTVVASANPPRGVLSVCNDVDADLKPVGAATNFSQGAAVKFHAAFPRHNGQRFVFWTIYKVGNDGKDESFVDNFEMGVKAEWKTFVTEETYSFPEPGKYRVYVLDYQQGNSSDKSGNYEKYLAKAEVTVK